MKKLIGVMSLLLASTSAVAGDFYVGLHYAQSSNDDFCKEAYFGEFDSCDDKASGNKVAVGFQFNDYFSLELARIDSGDLTARERYNEDLGGGDFVRGQNKISADVTGWNIAAKGALPVNDALAFYIKGGLLSWESSIGVDWSQSWSFGGDTWSGSGSSSDSDSGQDLSFGFGMEVKASESVQFVVEWQQLANIEIDLGDDSFETDVEMISLGLQYVF